MAGEVSAQADTPVAPRNGICSALGSKPLPQFGVLPTPPAVSFGDGTQSLRKARPGKGSKRSQDHAISRGDPEGLRSHLPCAWVCCWQTVGGSRCWTRCRTTPGHCATASMGRKSTGRIRPGQGCSLGRWVQDKQLLILTVGWGL